MLVNKDVILEVARHSGEIDEGASSHWHQDDEILADGSSPWDQYGYRKKPLFYYRNQPVRHRLVQLNKQT